VDDPPFQLHYKPVLDNGALHPLKPVDFDGRKSTFPHPAGQSTKGYLPLSRIRFAWLSVPLPLADPFYP